MAAAKGTRPPNAGKGRVKGSANKSTIAAREMFQRAAQGLGGLPALIDWAKDEPGEFWKLYARLIPVEHTGAEGAALMPKVVVYTSVPDA